MAPPDDDVIADQPAGLPLLDEDERIRYGWQMTIPGFGEDGQRRLKAATVVVSRVGGVGGSAAQYLAAAGVGRLVLIHGGRLRLDDLNRQMLMDTAAVGTPRVTCAAARLREINPSIEVIEVPEHPRPEGVRPWIAQAHAVVCAAPLFEERHALHAAAAEFHVPCVEAAMYQMEGYVTVVHPPTTPAYPDWCPPKPEWWQRRFPVVGAVAGTIGALAAVETIKVLTNIGEPLLGRLWHMDFSTARSRIVTLPRC